MEALLRTILRQRVTYHAAAKSWAQLVRKLGTPAPGPESLLLPPCAEQLAHTPYFRLAPLGIEQRRAETIQRLCTRQLRADQHAIEPLRDGPVAAAHAALQTISGIGPWTIGMAAGLALGDPDAVVPRDLHLPRAVGWELSGDPTADDDQMLKLLEPYRGHRFRLVRLLWAGKVHAPRR